MRNLNRRRRSFALAATMALAVTAGCGSDGDSSDANGGNADTNENAAAHGNGAATGGNGGGGEPDGADGGSASDTPTDDASAGFSELDAFVVGIEAALNADRVEVVDGALHVHLGEPDPMAGSTGNECMIINASVPDGTTTILFHPDGTEERC